MSKTHTTYHTIEVDGINLFYRKAGNPANPTLVLLHGYPSSSFMFRDLMAQLSDQFYLIAPDYPGFGYSDAPDVSDFAYTFDHLADVTEQFLKALGVTRFNLYVQDYGAPVGFRIASRHPEWIQALIVQNGNAYEEGFTQAWQAFRELWQDRNEATEGAVKGFFAPETTRFFYTEGVRNAETLTPDTWTLDQSFLDRPANRAAQLELFYDYRNNPVEYPKWHTYLRDHQPPTLLVWGKNDPFFGPEGATAFQRDVPGAELHFLDTGHFALEEDGVEIAGYIRAFLS